MVGLTIAAIFFSLIVAYGLFGFLPLPAQTMIFGGGVLAYMVIFLKGEHKEFFYPTPTTDPLPVELPPRRMYTPPAATVPAQPVQVASGGGFYAREAALLERILQDNYGLKCAVDRDPFKSHTFVGYPIRMYGKTFDALEKLLENLASDLAEDEARAKVMQIDPETGERIPVSVRLDRDSQPAILQVTRPRVKYLDWDGSESWGRDPLDVVLGGKVVYDRVQGSRTIPVAVPMRNTDRMSFLFLGISQSGKSTLMNAALVRLLRRNSPDKLKVWICDPKGAFYPPYADVAHIQDWTDNVTDAKMMLNHFLNICSDGSEEGSDTYKLLIIDEWHRLTRADSNMEEKLKAIINSGATKNIRVWVATTEIEKDIVSQHLKNAFHVVSSHYNRNDQYVQGTLGISGTTGLMRRYESILVVDSHTSRLSTFNFTTEIFRRELAALPRRVADRQQDVPETPIELIAETDLEGAVSSFVGQSEMMHNGKLSVNRVYAALFPGKGRGSSSMYPKVSAIVRKLNGE